MRACCLVVALMLLPRLALACALDVSVVRRVIEAGRADVRACYENALELDAALQGQVHVRWTVGSNGNVTRVVIAKVDPGMKRVSRCVAGVIGKWRFPRILGGGTATVLYPFVFASKS